MATIKKQPAMEWTDEHDVLLLREILVGELFMHKKGSPERGKIWEAIQDRLNKLDTPKFVIKDKRGVRDRWNLLQSKFKKRMQEEEKASGIECEMSEKDVLIEELCNKEESLNINEKKKSSDKEAAEAIRKKAMERMKRNASGDSTSNGAKKSRRSGGEMVEFLKEKAKSEQSIRQEEMELRKKEQEAMAKQQELQIELLRKQSEQQMQISQALMAMIQNLANR